MKKFLTKVSLYIGILLAIIIPVSVYYFNKMPRPCPLVSNSASYNLKAAFVQQHPEKLRDAGIVVVGSSMAMNNVDAIMLRDSFHRPVINLGSWMLTIAGYKGSPLWNENKTFLISLGVPDLGDGDSHVDVKDNFSFQTSSRLQEAYNFETDFRSFLDVAQQEADIMKLKGNSDYLSCDFDECGSVIFSDSGFHISDNRWNADVFASFGVDSAKVLRFVKNLQYLMESHHGYKEIMLSFSPNRRIFYNRTRSETIAYLGQLIHEKCPNALFFNMYDHNYPDSLYADNCHFNARGARRFGRELIDSMQQYSVGANSVAK